jgi:type II secretory pathway component HofQ
MKLISAIHWVIYFLLIVSLTDFSMHPAWAAGATLQVQYRGNRLSLSAVDADIQSILLRISEETGIYVQFPRSLQKNMSLSLSEVKLEKALKRLLKGLNYATVYAASNNRNTVQVSKVFIFEDYKETARSRRLARRERRNRTRIDQYNKRIASIKRRLDKVPHDSPAGRRYRNQIQNYQKRIDRLER